MNEIKEKIEQVVKKLTADKNLMAKFDKNPVKVIEELLGVDLPDDIVKKVVEGVKAKIKLDKVGDADRPNSVPGAGGMDKYAVENK